MPAPKKVGIKEPGRECNKRMLACASLSMFGML